LNVWLDPSTDFFIDMPIYDRGGGELPAGIEGLPCWIAVDMSTTTDLSGDRLIGSSANVRELSGS
jgi:hypothetical protein